MAWRYPKWRDLDGYPVDIDSINEDFEATVEEMEGSLNEHNWAYQAVTSLDDVAPDALVQFKEKYQTVNPTIGVGNPPARFLPTNGFQVAANLDWCVIDDMSTTVNTDTANLWIMASFQHQGSDPDAGSFRLGVQYGIRIDGTLLWETVVGGADRSNDLRGEGFGGSYGATPFVIDAILPVVSGQHLVEIVARTPRNENFDTLQTDDYWMVFNRELIIMELY